MEHEETYQGRRFVVTTSQATDGAWSYTASLSEGESPISVTASGAATYPSETEAWRAGVSAAAGAIDRSRTMRGKP
jgi:hypothetical protein